MQFRWVLGGPGSELVGPSPGRWEPRRLWAAGVPKAGALAPSGGSCGEDMGGEGGSWGPGGRKGTHVWAGVGDSLGLF